MVRVFLFGIRGASQGEIAAHIPSSLPHEPVHILSLTGLYKSKADAYAYIESKIQEYRLIATVSLPVAIRHVNIFVLGVESEADCGFIRDLGGIVVHVNLNRSPADQVIDGTPGNRNVRSQLRICIDVIASGFQIV